MRLCAPQGRRVKGTIAGIILALFFQSIPQAAGQQASSSETTYPSPSHDLLPDSPGAVQSASMRVQASSQQEPVSSAPTDPDKAANGSDTQDSSAQVPPMPELTEQAPAETTGAAESEEIFAPPQNAAQSEPPQRPHEPVGTAAAESLTVTGVAASRPAGAAVAPAKQRRVRSMMIKVGALVGVGVAVGATLALSQGSPSKPPGSH